MTNQITIQQSDFEKIKYIESNQEYWLARELMNLLGYAKWDTFSNVIEKAKNACELSYYNILDHFPEVKKPIIGGKGAVQEVLDYKLSRYACYLIAQNGDSRKSQIATAQTYFAIQTRKQEIFEQLTEDQKRLEIRDQVTKSTNPLNSYKLFTTLPLYYLY
jgi:DNA-damage-inducible protein D